MVFKTKQTKTKRKTPRLCHVLLNDSDSDFEKKCHNNTGSTLLYDCCIARWTKKRPHGCAMYSKMILILDHSGIRQYSWEFNIYLNISGPEMQCSRLYQITAKKLHLIKNNNRRGHVLEHSISTKYRRHHL